MKGEVHSLPGVILRAHCVVPLKQEGSADGHPSCIDQGHAEAVQDTDPPRMRHKEEDGADSGRNDQARCGLHDRGHVGIHASIVGVKA